MFYGGGYGIRKGMVGRSMVGRSDERLGRLLLIGRRADCAPKCCKGF